MCSTKRPVLADRPIVAHRTREAQGIVGTHTFLGDLDFFLLRPAATVVQLFEQACATSDDFRLQFLDTATGKPPCPAIDGGTYAPVTPLCALAGEDSSGDWILRTVVNFAGDDGDNGEPAGWGLEIRIGVSETISQDGFPAKPP